jgi:hypothetical protein
MSASVNGNRRLSVVLAVATLQFLASGLSSAQQTVGRAPTPIQNGLVDSAPVFVILGEYGGPQPNTGTQSPPLSAAATQSTSGFYFSTVGSVTQLQFYGISAKGFSLYALSSAPGGSSTVNFKVDAVASCAGTGSTTPAVQTCAIANFFVNPGDLLAFVGTGPYYAAPSDAVGSDATYTASSQLQTAPIGTAFSVSASASAGGTYSYLPESPQGPPQQGRMYNIQVTYTPTYFPFSAGSPPPGVVILNPYVTDNIYSSAIGKSWSQSGNWLRVPPASGAPYAFSDPGSTGAKDNVYAVSATGTTQTTIIEYDGHSFGGTALSNLVVDAVDGGGITLNQSQTGSYTLTTDTEVVGLSGTGSYLLSSGINAVTGSLVVAQNFGSTGTYTLESTGTLQVSGAISINSSGGNFIVTNNQNSPTYGAFSNFGTVTNEGTWYHSVAFANLNSQEGTALFLNKPPALFTILNGGLFVNGSATPFGAPPTARNGAVVNNDGGFINQFGATLDNQSGGTFQNGGSPNAAPTVTGSLVNGVAPRTILIPNPPGRPSSLTLNGAASILNEQGATLINLAICQQGGNDANGNFQPGSCTGASLSNSNGSTFTNNGTVTNEWVLTNGGSGTSFNNAGNFTNVYNVGAWPNSAVQCPGSGNNDSLCSGYFNNEAGATVSDTGTFTNGGTVDNAGTFSVGIEGNNIAGTLVNNRLINNSGLFGVYGSATLLGSGAPPANSGTYNQVSGTTSVSNGGFSQYELKVGEGSTFTIASGFPLPPSAYYGPWVKSGTFVPPVVFAVFVMNEGTVNIMEGDMVVGLFVNFGTMAIWPNAELDSGYGVEQFGQKIQMAGGKIRAPSIHVRDGILGGWGEVAAAVTLTHSELEIGSSHGGDLRIAGRFSQRGGRVELEVRERAERHVSRLVFLGRHAVSIEDAEIVFHARDEAAGRTLFAGGKVRLQDFIVRADGDRLDFSTFKRDRFALETADGDVVALSFDPRSGDLMRNPELPRLAFQSSP